MAHVLRLPDRGRLIVCTDLQGCLRDFQAVVEVFLQANSETSGDAHLIFTGDLIHGPYIAEHEWPDYLGEYYRDQSIEVLDGFRELSRRFAGHVHALLGNHEHGHIGGPHTAKFAMDEVVLLESLLGPEGTLRLHELLRSFPLAAIAPCCGAVLTHAAPGAAIDSVADIERVEISGHDYESILDILDVPVIGPMLWARSATPNKARRFVTALGCTISIYGHDVVPEGFERIGDEQIVVSTSFGVPDGNKVYLDLDLGRRYGSVNELEVGREIRPLYPAKASRALGGLLD